MRKVICVLMLFAMVLGMAACGAEEAQDEVQVPAADVEIVESTLTPREQFEKMKQEMDKLNGEEKKEESSAVVTPVTYTTNGITYTLDSTFTSAGEAADNAQHKYISDLMWITEQISGNTFGYTSSQELAEYIASQKESRVVGSKNGVYYVEEADSKTVKAYYVDDSGYYWIISGFVTGGNDYGANRDALIAFCTSGKLN